MPRLLSRPLLMVYAGVLILGLLTPCARAQEKFTLAVIPDSQQEVMKDDNVILLTHAFLAGKGDIQTNNGGYGDKSPQFIFDSLLKPCANVRLVFCGHVGSHGYRTDKGDHGNTLYEFLQCYHDNTANPVRLFEIDPKKKTLTSRVYCPSTDQTKDDGSTLTVRDIEWVQPEGRTRVPAGNSMDKSTGGIIPSISMSLSTEN